MFEEARRCIFGGKRDGADGRQKASWAELTGKVFWRVVAAAAAVVAAASGGLRQQQLEDTQVDRRRSLARGNTAAETGNTTAVPGNTTGQYHRAIQQDDALSFRWTPNLMASVWRLFFGLAKSSLHPTSDKR